MGLDITAYRKLKEVRPVDENVEDDGYEEGLVKFYENHGSFSGRMDGVKTRTLYSFAEDMRFRAGSYIGYNQWRDWLAGLVGTTCEKVWGAPVPGPFVELINFTDCDGTIGAAVSAKLAREFAEWDGAASKGEELYYERYREWKAAFEMAADGGAVSFH